jgi:hypothetical protein
MGFGSKAKKGKTGGGTSGKKEAVWRNLGTIWESDKFDGQYFATQKPSSDFYPGDLIFKDKQTGKYYLVKQISLFAPKDGAPRAAVSNLVLNLNNSYQVELIAEDDQADAAPAEEYKEEE